MADKIVKLVDKNSNNLYPVAGSVIDNAVSTGAISSQAVNNAKIENGAVNGVENNATAIGTAKLALDTVGTPNLRDASVTSDKIDWQTLGNGLKIIPNQGSPVNITGGWERREFGETITFDNLVIGGKYLVFGQTNWSTPTSTAPSDYSIGIIVKSGGVEKESLMYSLKDTYVGLAHLLEFVADDTTASVRRTAYYNANGQISCSATVVAIIRIG